MSSYSIPFIDIGGPEEQVARLRAVLERLHPRWSKWLRRATITNDQITLVYNINTPTVRWLEKELVPRLHEAGLPERIEATFVRPGELHPDAERLFGEIKDRLGKSSDLRWLGEHKAALFYLAQYRFIAIDYDNEVLGFDASYSKIWFKSWISRISVTEEEGREFLNTWRN